MVTVTCAYVDSINKRSNHMMFTDMSKFRAYMRRKGREGMGIDYIHYWNNSITGNINVSIRLFPIEDLIIRQPGYQIAHIFRVRNDTMTMISLELWDMKYNYPKNESIIYV